jgi:pimeloyl-ACP methyl ester carboxylesterase
MTLVGEGRPLALLHGWCCDRSWWTEPGYVDELRTDHRLINVDLRGHGASDKPHEPAAYTSDALTGDVFAVADAGAWIGSRSGASPTAGGSRG